MKCKIKYPCPLGLQLLGEKKSFSCFVCHYLAFFLCVRNKCGLEIQRYSGSRMAEGCAGVEQLHADGRWVTKRVVLAQLSS